MGFDLEARHWALMITAAILAAAGMFIVPQAVAIYTVTTYWFAIIAAAVILNTLGAATERFRVQLKLLAWVCLCAASFTALWPLRGALSGFLGAVESGAGLGPSLSRVLQEVVTGLAHTSEPEHKAMAISATLGALSLIVTVCMPFLAIWIIRRRAAASRSESLQADWITPFDITQLGRNKTGLPLAVYQDKLLRYRKRGNVSWRGAHHLVISGDRGAQSASAVIPAILDHQGPVVCMDIQGETCAVTRRYREALGRKVVVLNPFGLGTQSVEQFNPLDYVQSEHIARDTALIADGLVQSDADVGTPIIEAARQLIAATIEVVLNHNDPSRRTLLNVADMLCDPSLEGTLEAWAENADLVGARPSQAAAGALRLGQVSGDDLRAVVCKAFDWMQADQTRHFLSASSAWIDDLLADRADFFIVVPREEVERQAVFMRLFTNLVLGRVMARDGARLKGKATLLFVLDEFVRMGRMEQIMTMATAQINTGIEALFVTDEAEQIEKAYGPSDTGLILASCVTKRVVNLTNVDAVVWAAHHLAANRTRSQRTSQDEAAHQDYDPSERQEEYTLMIVEQIMALNADEVLVFIANRGPLTAKQNMYHQTKTYFGKFDVVPQSSQIEKKAAHEEAVEETEMVVVDNLHKPR